MNAQEFKNLTVRLLEVQKALVQSGLKGDIRIGVCRDTLTELKKASDNLKSNPYTSAQFGTHSDLIIAGLRIYHEPVLG